VLYIEVSKIVLVYGRLFAPERREVSVSHSCALSINSFGRSLALIRKPTVSDVCLRALYTVLWCARCVCVCVCG